MNNRDKMRWKTNHCFVVCLITLVILKSSSVIGKRDDDEDEDPYTTTDPKKREPSPCESMIADVIIAQLLFRASDAFCLSFISI